MADTKMDVDEAAIDEGLYSRQLCASALQLINLGNY